jgi:transposase InsO family protein
MHLGIDATNIRQGGGVTHLVQLLSAASPRYETRAEMTAMSFEYIEVLYNRKRQHSSLGYKSPIRFLDDWLITQQKEKLVV